VNDQKIYALMLKTPGIRAVQIADALDKDLADVSAALRPLVEVGDVVQSKGLSPNGHPAMVYDLSDAFKKSREYKALVATLPQGQAQSTTPAAAVVLEPTSSPPPNEAATSKVDRAIAFITKFGAASDNELRDAMTLPAKASPLAYLASAVKAGRVVRDGSHWKLGNGQRQSVASKPAPMVKPDATAQPDDVANVLTVGNIVVASRDSKPIPPAVVAAIASSSEPAVALPPVAPAAPVFRCGLWSDGVLELQRDGMTVATLEQAEGEQLASFVNRMLLDPLGTAVQTSARGHA
jgi:hypothetical protein